MSRVPRPAAVALLLALGAGIGLWWLAAPGALVSSTASREVRAPSLSESLGAPTLRGLAAPTAPGAAADGQAPERPREPQEEPPWRSLRIDVVDALTGRDLAATWNLGSGEVLAAPFGRDQVIDDAAIERQAKGVEDLIAAWEGRFLPSGRVRADTLWAGDYQVTRLLAVRPPAGFVLLAPPARVETALAVGVDSLTAVVPVIREAVLDVHVVGPDGRAAQGARLVHFAVGGVAWAHKVEDTGPGTLRVRGIPHLAGERISAGIEWGGSDGEAAPPPVELESEEPPSNLAASIPESLATPWTVELRLSAPTGSLGDHVETDFDMAFEELVLEEVPPLGSLRIRLVGRDGVQVRGEPLLGLTPDAKGEVVLERLRPGELELCVRTPGRLPARHATLVRADQEVVATLREPAGARLEVVVVDEEGRPRPTALLQIRGAAFFDVDGSTQRADLFTDHLGRRSISRVEPGEAEIHASWGSRKGFEKVTLVDGETTRVRIVAK